jgi:uncharacterized membrane protein YiaA
MTQNLELKALTVGFFSLFLQGCSLNEKELWGFGSVVFFVFIVTTILSKIVPQIQEISKVQKLIERLKIGANKSFVIFMFISIAMIIIGLYNIITNDDRVGFDVIFFIGAVFMYFSINMKKWANETNKLKSRNSVRLMGLSLGFIVMFIYIMFGAPNLNI